MRPEGPRRKRKPNRDTSISNRDSPCLLPHHQSGPLGCRIDFLQFLMCRVVSGQQGSPLNHLAVGTHGTLFALLDEWGSFGGLLCPCSALCTVKWPTNLPTFCLCLHALGQNLPCTPVPVLHAKTDSPGCSISSRARCGKQCEGLWPWFVLRPQWDELLARVILRRWPGIPASPIVPACG